MAIVSHLKNSQKILKDNDQDKNDNDEKASNGKKNKTNGGRGGRNEGGGGKGKRDRRDRHPPLLWYEAVRDDAYAIYNTLDMCLPDTKNNKRKKTTTMTTDNVYCDHYTVREGIKS